MQLESYKLTPDEQGESLLYVHKLLEPVTTTLSTELIKIASMVQRLEEKVRSIEEDADVGVTLMELNENGDKKILATLFKNRYGDKKNITYKYRLDNRLCLILENKNYV